MKKENLKYHSTILKNNIRLDIYEKKDSPICLSFNFLCGDVFNKDENKKGLAHFVEHLISARNKNFNTTEKMSLFLNKIGGDFRAFTDKEYMTLIIKVANNKFIKELFFILESSLKNFLYTDKYLKIEKEIIETEDETWNKDDFYANYDKLNSIINQNNEYKHKIIGTKKSIQSFTKKDVKDFIKNNLVGGKIGICISGDIKKSLAIEMCEKYLSFIPKTEILRVGSKDKIKKDYKENQENKINKKEKQEDRFLKKIIFTKKDILSSHFYIGLKNESYFSDDLYVEKRFLREIINNFIFDKIVFQKGMCYSLNSFWVDGFYNNFFAIEATCKNENLLKVLQEIKFFLEKDIFKIINQERFKNIKNKILFEYKYDKERSVDFMEDWKKITLTNKKYNYFTFIEDLENLSIEKIKKVCFDFFKNKEIYYSYSSNKNLDEEIDKILKK